MDIPGREHWFWKATTVIATVVLSATLPNASGRPGQWLMTLLLFVALGACFQHAFRWPALPRSFWRLFGVPFLAWAIVSLGRDFGWHFAMLATGVHPHHSTAWILTSAAAALFAAATFLVPVARLGEWEQPIERLRQRLASPRRQAKP